MDLYIGCIVLLVSLNLAFEALLVHRPLINWVLSPIHNYNPQNYFNLWFVSGPYWAKGVWWPPDHGVANQGQTIKVLLWLLPENNSVASLEGQPTRLSDQNRVSSNFSNYFAAFTKIVIMSMLWVRLNGHFFIYQNLIWPNKPVTAQTTITNWSEIINSN